MRRILLAVALIAAGMLTTACHFGCDDGQHSVVTGTVIVPVWHSEGKYGGYFTYLPVIQTACVPNGPTS